MKEILLTMSPFYKASVQMRHTSTQILTLPLLTCLILSPPTLALSQHAQHMLLQFYNDHVLSYIIFLIFSSLMWGLNLFAMRS